MRKTQLVFRGFEDGMGPRDRKFGTPPETGKSKEMELPLEPSERNTVLLTPQF